MYKKCVSLVSKEGEFDFMLWEKIIDWCESEVDFLPGERETVRFGLEMCADSVLKLLGLMITGIFLGKWTEFVVVLLFFCSLRIWAGGKHCKTSIGCFLFMLLTCIVSVFGSEGLRTFGRQTMVVIWLVCLSAIVIEVITILPINYKRS